ncbi:hypothetical protein [Xanthomonas axonopodis]|uniref:hypothetical protein n=1 Tax=Xanthomonas axonopodis TaxID=53413 RepID=UPI0020C958C2|nr:hypothetical protein [Xanthomonas axonopodis]
MAISKPPGFSSIVIALLYLIVAMDPTASSNGEHAVFATPVLAKISRRSMWDTRRQRDGVKPKDLEARRGGYCLTLIAGMSCAMSEMSRYPGF